MADGVIFGDSSSQINSNYEKYSDYFTKETSQTLGQSDFLTLMIQQLSNQDFNNPVDDTEFIAQMAQFSTLQAQQNALYYSQASYASSLIGKEVSVGLTDSSGAYLTDRGKVEAVTLTGKDFTFTVNGKDYSAANIMQIVTDGYNKDKVNDTETVADEKTETQNDEIAEILSSL